MGGNNKWTNFVRFWSSADSCAGAIGVAAEVDHEEARVLIRVWTEMNGNTGKPAWNDDPDRVWWPDKPPTRVTTKFVALSKRLLAGSNPEIHGMLVERVATGSFPLAKDVPQGLREAFRAMAVSDDTDDIFEAVVGPPISRSCGLGPQWFRFFRFLQRLGIPVREMPHKDSGMLNAMPLSFQHYAIQMLFEGVTVVTVSEDPPALA